MEYDHLGRVVQSWVKITQGWCEIEFRYESSKIISILILFVYKLMIGSSKINKENYPRKCFWTQEKETQVKFNPGLSANRPSNTGSRVSVSIVLIGQSHFWHWLLKPQSLSQQHSYSGLHSTGLFHLYMYEIHVNYHRRSCTK